MTNHNQATYNGEPELQATEDAEYSPVETDFAPNQKYNLHKSVELEQTFNYLPPAFVRSPSE